MNIIAAEGGEVWRRHRRIMGPAFNNETYGLVWEETVRVYKEMMVNEKWDDKEIVEIPVAQQYTFKVRITMAKSECTTGLNRIISLRCSSSALADSDYLFNGHVHLPQKMAL